MEHLSNISFESEAIYVPSGSDADTDDELNVMAASSPHIQRTLRERRATVAAPPKKKRVRKMSAGNEARLQERAVKKQKMDDKKAVTLTVNLKKISLDAARTRWLYRHRDLFEPLLPSTSFGANLQKEINGTKDKGIYVARHPVEEQPQLVTGGIMKDYQLEGLAFLVWMYNNGMNCILGDEMGLGKTLQTLALFAHIKENANGARDPHLVICPLSVLSSWLAETARWVPNMRAFRFHGIASERTRLKESFRSGSFDICITTYDIFSAEESWFKTRRWTYCVLDEGHKIKNSEANLTQKIQGIGSLFRLLLTGTPIQNNLTELWALLHWLYPSVFKSSTEEPFKTSFDLQKGIYSLPFLSAAQNLLSTIMIRRTKAIVEVNLPPKETLTVFLPLTELQRFWTYRLLTKMDQLDLRQIFTTKISPENGQANEGRREVLAQLENHMQPDRNVGGQGNQWKKLMNLLMQLRRVCDHPYILPSVEPEPFIMGEHIVAGSSKLIFIDKLLANILPSGERVLIFSQWTGMLDILEDFMALRAIPYARLDGSTSRPRRTLDIKLFQQEKSPYQVFLMSTKAGGLGINLAKASTVIMCDCDWNPQNDLQAIARAHRIGQTKVVKVYQLVCRGSVEDQMLDRIRRKLFLSLKVVGSGESSATMNSTLAVNELLDILRRGSSALSNADGGMGLERFLDASIEEILAESRSREELREAKVKGEIKQEIKEEVGTDAKIGIKEEVKVALDVKPDVQLLRDAEEEERKLLCGIAQVQCRLFEGKVVEPPKNNKGIAMEWQELQKRARTDKIIMVDGMPMIAAYMGPTVASTGGKIVKEKKPKHGSEDWCVYCRDGGKLLLCSRCPRVFHKDCHEASGFGNTQISVSCSQHNCASCRRSTADAGGMLFRCQTCPQAFCEDCMPEGELDAIGDVLPEFELLGYGAKDNAYFIRCHDCQNYFAENPKDWEAWQAEMRETRAKLDGP